MTVPYKFKYEPYKRVFIRLNLGEEVLTLIGGKKNRGRISLFNYLNIKNIPDIEIPTVEDQLNLYHGRNIYSGYIGQIKI